MTDDGMGDMRLSTAYLRHLAEIAPGELDRRYFAAVAAEIERLRAENERYYLLFTKLQDIAGDRRFSDEFVGRSARRRLGVFAAATKEDDHLMQRTSNDD